MKKESAGNAALIQRTFATPSYGTNTVVPPLDGAPQPKTEQRNKVSNPKKKKLQTQQSTKYITHYILGVGPLNKINERGPHLPPINVQLSVLYNNPN